MRLLIKLLYVIAVALGIAVVVLAAVGGNTSIFDKGPTDVLEAVKQLDVQSVGEQQTLYSFIAPAEIKDGIVLAVSTMHNEVEIRKNGELVYSEKHSPKMFGDTTGYGWAFVPLTQKDAGTNFTVLTTACYPETVVNEVDMYLGTVQSVCRYIIGNYAFALLVGILLIFIGIVLIVFSLAFINTHKKLGVKINYSMVYLGVFSVLLGLWSGNQSVLTSLFITSKPLSAVINLVPFALMISAFVFFVKEYFKEPNHWIWNTVSLVNVFSVIVIMVLQIFEVVDLRQSLITIHLVIAVTVVTIIGMIIREVVLHKVKTSLKILLIPIAICALSAVADVIAYYLGSMDSNFFGRLAFLVLVCCTAYSAIKESNDLQTRAKRTDLYKRLAISDSMTGFRNRAALSFAINEANYGSSKDYGIVMLDLNDLKHCNDTLGHKVGDEYICSASKLISEAFNDYGICYRYGGDEFVVMIKSPQWNKTMKQLEFFEELQKKCNDGTKQFEMAIAWGYAEFRKDYDTNLDDTLIRADKSMYENKLAMKQRNTCNV